MTMSQWIISTGNKTLQKSQLAVKNSPNIIHMAHTAKTMEPECAEVLNWLLTALASCRTEGMFFSFHCISFISFSDYLIQTWKTSWELKKQRS